MAELRLFYGNAAPFPHGRMPLNDSHLTGMPPFMAAMGGDDGHANRRKPCDSGNGGP
jgi:hypothetical protein